MSAFTPLYTVIYHEAITGRSGPIQALLIDANIPYVMKPVHWTGPDKVVENNTGNPVFACPTIRKGDFTLSQLNAIMTYLGQEHGYVPSSKEDLHACNQISLDIADFFAEVFKNIGDKEGDRCVSYFAENGRGQQWITHITKFYQKQNKGSIGYIFGETITYADFFLLNTVETLIFFFGEEKTTSYLSEELNAHLKLMKSRPGFEKYSQISTPQLFPSMKFNA